MNPNQFQQSVKFFNEKFDEIGAPSKVWSANTRRNLLRMNHNDSIWTLQGLLADEKEKAVIIVGASPCLKNDISKLRNLDRTKFCIIVVNSGLKFLLDHSIIPDYVVAIDGDPENIVGHLDCDNKDLTLLTSNAVAPEIFDVWKGKSYWMPYYAIDKDLKVKVRNKIGRMIPCGGNSFTTAAAMAYLVFDARMFIFVANECCYDEQYYVDKKSKWEKPDIIHFNVTDTKGRQRYTNIPLFQYKMWLEHMCSNMTDATFIDTSFGIVGTDSERVYVMELEDSIKFVVDAFETKEKMGSDWYEREKLRYNLAYSTGNYIPTVGRGLWPRIKKNYNFSDKIKTILDVGCGVGHVVAMTRNDGYESHGVDISEGAVDYWVKAGIGEFCKVAPAHNIPFADNTFDVVMCTDVMEHIPEEGVLPTFKEIRRVGRHTFFFTIAIMPAIHKMPNDQSEPHVCVKYPDWWKDRLEEAGFMIETFLLTKSQSNILIWATKHDKGRMRHNDLLIQPKQDMHPGIC